MFAARGRYASRGLPLPLSFQRQHSFPLDELVDTWARSARLEILDTRCDFLEQTRQLRIEPDRVTLICGSHRLSETVAMKLSGHLTRSEFDRYNITDSRDLQEAAERA